MRIGRPAGFYVIYIPPPIGLGYAASIAFPTPSLERVAFLSGLFAFGCIILRGAACAWNDNIDQEFDRKVTRCRLRSIARGAVSTTQGHLFTAALTLVGTWLLTFLPTNCVYHAMPITILLAVYPFVKRFPNYPQIFLGFPFAWGILMAAEALEVKILSKELVMSTMSIFLAIILWTMIYDTVYAHQDLKDGIKAGAKSMAVRFAYSTKVLVSVLAIIQVGLLVLAGCLVQMLPVYYLGTCGGSAVALVFMINKVDLEDPRSCAWFFNRGFGYVGGSIVAGFFAEWAVRLYGFDGGAVGMGLGAWVMNIL